MKTAIAKKIFHIIAVIITAASLASCDDMYSKAQSVINTGNLFAKLGMFFRIFGNPQLLAQGVYFNDMDMDEGQIAGLLTVGRALNESEITGYVLYWGSSASTKLAGAPAIQEMSVLDMDLVHAFTANFPIPAGATHFLVYSKRGEEEIPTPVSLDIPDAVLHVMDIQGGPASSSTPKWMTVFNNNLYFQAYDSTNATELWVYNDTVPEQVGVNPIIAKDIYPNAFSSNPSNLAVFNNSLYFWATNGASTQLWRYTPPITYDTIAITSSLTPSVLSIFNNKLCFKAVGADGDEFFYYDGATYTEYPINPVPAMSSNPQYFAVFNNKLYFQADNGTAGAELYVYNGTNTPSLVYDIISGGDYSGPKYLTVFNNNLYFSAKSIGPPDENIELWVYNGINTPTMAYDIYPGTLSSLPKYLYAFNNRLYFSATNGISGRELYEYDGTTAPISFDLNSGSGDSNPMNFCAFNNKLFFTTTTSSDGTRLWVYDGHTNPTYITTISPSFAPDISYYLTVYNNKLYFQGQDTPFGIELWVYSEK